MKIEGLSNDELRKLAYETGFVKRTSQKIDAPDFLALMCIESQKGSPSYNDLASRYETVYKNSATKQAVSKKINQSCVLFFQTVLSLVIMSKMPKSEIEVLKINCGYGRIIIQDSTIIRLPLRLFKIFSGVANAHASVCNARIQGVYDLLSGNFISFSIDSYSKNDFSAAPELEIKKNDLILRDRGYFTNAEVKRHKDLGADCIYRHKFKTKYIDSISGEAIDLKKMLKRKKNLDIEVCLNDSFGTNVRLIAVPVSKEVTDQRRMKAKIELRGHNPSAELLELMAWSIFITTIPKDKTDLQKILIMYRLRWRIENIFKTWKSYMQFEKVHNVSENQLRTILTARFIMIVINTQNIYNPCYRRIFKEYNREISMMKFINYLMKNPEKIIVILTIKENDSLKMKILDETLIRYCGYDKRKRLNFNQITTMALN